MNNKFNITLIVLRLSVGWYMFFAGLEKLTTPNWTSLDFLLNAQTFTRFYIWLSQPENIWWVDKLNAWGMIFIGLALLLGVFVRPAALCGALLMLLYYFPQHSLPIVPHGYIVEEHIIESLVFILIAYAPKDFSLSIHLQDTFLVKIPILGKFV